MGEGAPPELTALGNLGLLALPQTALFCSARCPGNVILPTYYSHNCRIREQVPIQKNLPYIFTSI
jgi:hypothetical protein